MSILFKGPLELLYYLQFTNFLKMLLLYLVSDIFGKKSEILLCVEPVTLLLLLPPPFQRKSLQLEHHLYIGTVSHHEKMRLFVKVQETLHEQLGEYLYPHGSLLKVYCISSQVNTNFSLPSSCREP